VCVCGKRHPGGVERTLSVHRTRVRLDEKGDRAIELLVIAREEQSEIHHCCSREQMRCRTYITSVRIRSSSAARRRLRRGARTRSDQRCARVTARARARAVTRARLFSVSLTFECFEWGDTERSDRLHHEAARLLARGRE